MHKINTHIKYLYNVLSELNIPNPLHDSVNVNKNISHRKVCDQILKVNDTYYTSKLEINAQQSIPIISANSMRLLTTWGVMNTLTKLFRVNNKHNALAQITIHEKKSRYAYITTHGYDYNTLTYTCNSREVLKTLNLVIRQVEFLLAVKQNTDLSRVEYTRNNISTLLHICLLPSCSLQLALQVIQDYKLNLRTVVYTLNLPYFKHILKLVHPNTKFAIN